MTIDIAAALKFLERTLEVRPDWTLIVAIQRMYSRWPNTVDAIDRAIHQQVLIFFGHRVLDDPLADPNLVLIGFDSHACTGPDDRMLVVSMAALAADLEHAYAI